MKILDISTYAEKIKSNISKIIMGKDKEIEKLIIALFCRGNLLIEDIPGTGKTTLAKALAKSLGCNFKRIQFTPDLLPSDITGINFYNQKEGEFVFKPGPVFTHILLGDELNRATPRTQSSLLECMEERQVTIDGKTYRLEEPFMVIATQNPLETQGTFPLPEAQLDRFFMRLSLGYPVKEDEISVLTNYEKFNPLDQLEAVVTIKELLEIQELVKTVKVSEPVKEYIVALAQASRSHPDIKLGISIRGSLALFNGAKAHAALQKREFVIPDDVKALFKEVAMHRIILKEYQMFHESNITDKILSEILSQVPVPIE